MNIHQKIEQELEEYLGSLNMDDSLFDPKKALSDIYSNVVKGPPTGVLQVALSATDKDYPHKAGLKAMMIGREKMQAFLIKKLQEIADSSSNDSVEDLAENNVAQFILGRDTEGKIKQSLELYKIDQFLNSRFEDYGFNQMSLNDIGEKVKRNINSLEDGDIPKGVTREALIKRKMHLVHRNQELGNNLNEFVRFQAQRVLHGLSEFPTSNQKYTELLESSAKRMFRNAVKNVQGSYVRVSVPLPFKMRKNLSIMVWLDARIETRKTKQGYPESLLDKAKTVFLEALAVYEQNGNEESLVLSRTDYELIKILAPEGLQIMTQKYSVQTRLPDSEYSDSQDFVTNLESYRENGRLYVRDSQLVCWNQKEETFEVASTQGGRFKGVSGEQGFVLTTDDQMYRFDHDAGEPTTEEGSINFHSMINAGRSVLFAGSIVIKNGQVKSISDISGHYRPMLKSPDCLVTMLNKDLIKESTKLEVWESDFSQTSLSVGRILCRHGKPTDLYEKIIKHQDLSAEGKLRAKKIVLVRAGVKRLMDNGKTLDDLIQSGVFSEMTLFQKIKSVVRVIFSSHISKAASLILVLIKDNKQEGIPELSSFSPPMPAVSSSTLSSSAQEEPVKSISLYYLDGSVLFKNEETPGHESFNELLRNYSGDQGIHLTQAQYDEAFTAFEAYQNQDNELKLEGLVGRVLKGVYNAGPEDVVKICSALQEAQADPNQLAKSVEKRTSSEEVLAKLQLLNSATPVDIARLQVNLDALPSEIGVSLIQDVANAVFTTDNKVGDLINMVEVIRASSQLPPRMEELLTAIVEGVKPEDNFGIEDVAKCLGSHEVVTGGFSIPLYPADIIDTVKEEIKSQNESNQNPGPG